MTVTPPSVLSSSSGAASGDRTLHFDVHGLFTIAVDAEAPTADQLSEADASVHTLDELPAALEGLDVG